MTEGKITWHRYADVRLFREGEGWTVKIADGLLHSPHGEYGGILLDWNGPGDPPAINKEFEDWREIPDTDGKYQASSLGNIRSVERTVEYSGSRSHSRLVPGKTLRPSVYRGYPFVGLIMKGVRRTRTTATLVAAAFLGPRPEGMEVCHNDGQRGNSRADNLRYGTRLENEADKEIHGTRLKGERCPASILNEDQVREIRRRAVSEPHASIASDLGIKAATIQQIVNGKSWKCLPLMKGEAGTPEADAMRREALRKRRSDRAIARNKSRSSAEPAREVLA